MKAMRNIVIFHARATLAFIVFGANAFDEEIPLYRNKLSVDDLSRIISSEMKNEFKPVKDSLNFDDDDFFQRATDLEWSRAKQVQQTQYDSTERTEDKVSPQHVRRKGDRDLGQERNPKINVNNTTIEENMSTNNTLFPYVACVQKHGRSGHKCSVMVKEVFGEDLVFPLYNNEDMACYITSSLVETAENVTFPILVQPLLPEMKIGEDTVRSIEKDSPPPSRFNAFLCPQYSGKETTEIDVSTKLFESFAHRSTDTAGDRQRRSLVSETFLRGDYSEETKAHQRQLMWSDFFEEGVESIHRCDDIFSNITHSSSKKLDFITFIMPDLEISGTDTTSDPFSRERACMFSLLAGLVIRPEICSVEKVDDAALLNGEAQWIVQSGEDNRRPFFDKNIRGSGQVVACSDSGLDTDNCYFWDRSGEVAKNSNVDLSRRKVVQYVPFADDKAQFSSHGTHVAGTIVGRRASNGQTESDGRADGIAPDSKIAFFDIGGGRSGFLSTPNDSTDLFSPGLNAGAKIHSASWGSNFNGYGVQEREFDEFAYNNDDFLIIIAAGNSGSNRFRTDIPNTVGSPATAKNVIAVGASQSAGAGLQSGMRGKDYLADFSSRGPTRDGRRKPEIVAPGYYILSANANPNEVGECDDNGGVTFQAGTSMATPVVSGTAALVRQYLEDGWYPLGLRPVASNRIQPSASLVKAILLNGAQSLNGVDNVRRITQVRPYDNNQGFGRVSLIDSLPLAGENTFRIKIVDRQPINDGDTDTYDIAVNTNGGCSVSKLSVTLVWSDPPSLPNCQKCVLNDLDLFMTKVGSSNTIFPNGLSRRDSINNSERIQINVNNGDRYAVNVKAYDLDTARQNYSLVMTGCISDDITPLSPTPSPTESPVRDPTENPVSVPTTSSLPTSRPTKSPNSVVSGSLFTTFGGTYTQAGNMFNVRAERDIIIRSMNIHTTSTGRVQVEVYTRSGSYRAEEYSSRGWVRVAYAIVQGKGAGYATPVPAELFRSAVFMRQGEIRGFYITLNSPDIIYSVGTADGAVYVGNDDIKFGEGAAKAYPFGRSYKPRVWNGSFNYDVV